MRGASTPSLWADCKLALIPKPNKPAQRPENLRPLDLQDSGAQLLSEVGDTLLAYPMHAYLPGRSIETAIVRVIDHCRTVRAMHRGQTANVHTRRAQIKQQHSVGGLQLAIDLTTAFDMVPRDKLFQALIWAGAI